MHFKICRIVFYVKKDLKIMTSTILIQVFRPKTVQGKKNSFTPKKCLCWDDLIPTTRFKNLHDILNHYAETKSVAFEDKPLDIKFSRIVKIYEILDSKHSNCYNTKDADDTLKSFLNKVRSKFKPNTEVLINFFSCKFLAGACR